MKTNDLLLSSLNISEDGYSYKGLFILSDGSKSFNGDIAELESNDKIEALKGFFDLIESIGDIRNSLMDKIMEKATISSRQCEGENYEEQSSKKASEKAANTLDMA